MTTTKDKKNVDITFFELRVSSLLKVKKKKLKVDLSEHNWRGKKTTHNKDIILFSV